MDIQERWEKALKKTEILRPRVRPLNTFAATHVPYFLLSESQVNPGDTVVRKGEVVVEKPAIVLPFNLPQFEGFEFEEDMRTPEDMIMNFFLVRGVTFPSMKYNNRTDSIQVYEGGLSKAIDHYLKVLQQSEDVSTGLVAGPDDAWQFSTLIFTAGQIMRSADGDIRSLMDDYRKKGFLP